MILNVFVKVEYFTKKVEDSDLQEDISLDKPSIIHNSDSLTDLLTVNSQQLRATLFCSANYLLLTTHN
jgi:hypothetical protein